MGNNNSKTLILLGILAVMTSCQKGADGSFENAIYINRTSGETVSEMLVSGEETMKRSITAAIPMKVDQDVIAKVQARPDLAEEFNLKYGENAELLSEEYYELSSDTFEIPAGNVVSTEVSVNFKNLTNLPKKNSETYVLPVSIVSANVNVIESRAVKYFFIRGANLVNYAPWLDGDYDADNEITIVPGNYFKIDWRDKNLVKGWTSFTYEGLFWGRLSTVNSAGSNTRSNPEGIYSLMGTDKGIILRWVRNSGYYNKFRWLELASFGDGDDNQFHIEMPYEDHQNTPPLYDSWTYNYGLPNKQWFSLSVSYDGTTGIVKCWLDGEKIFEKFYRKNVELDIYPEGKKDPEFYLGYHNGQEHWWPGMMAECRVWNRALTDEEVAENPLRSFFVDPETAEGLIGYWKLSEGTGDISPDRSGNGNDAVANVAVEWRKISLPEE